MTSQPPQDPSGNYPPPPANNPPPPPGGYGGPPNNNLVWGIIAIFLCWPLAIVSIIKSTQVSNLWAQGRAAEAQQSADDAKKFAIWGLIAGGVLWLIAIILWVVLVAFAVKETSNIPSDIQSSLSSYYPSYSDYPSFSYPTLTSYP